MIKNTELLFASNNRGKVREMQRLFEGLPITFRCLPDFPSVKEVEETGLTFEENAALKARGYAGQTGLCALADDSGLEIAALGGAPGVHSSRYAGAHTGYDEKIRLLLHEIDRTGDVRRNARFVCEMALADKNGEILTTARGVCDGFIANELRGTNGFGYDPIFIPAGYDATFGELPDDIKQQISHRGHACVKIMRYLLDFIAV
ncbi:MAG: RdgB/HAM1 family non-canonical purine NTP pyrophosphatase [Acidobacteriota bacterium]|nr:RdgB/HAM1 family non-canonical purine NTP pyrophosphatase [Acidobacteriota bacterium]